MKNKRVLAALLIAAMTVGLTACGCRLPRLLTQQGLTTIERVDDAG